MSEGLQRTWTCSGCGRRVPVRVERCHCGTTREASAAQASEGQASARRDLPQPGGPAGIPATGTRGTSAAAVWRSLPRDSKAFAVAGVLLLVGGLGWSVFGPSEPNAAPALLGYMDKEPPPPPKARAIHLPWWRYYGPSR